MNRKREQQMQQYLLGQLPETEREDLEARYFADDALFQQLLGVEAELRDAYARRQMSERDRRDFETYLLASNGQRQQQQFSELLRNNLLQQAPARPAPRAPGCRTLLWAVGRRRLVLIPALSVSLLIVLSAAWWMTRHNGVQRATAPPQNAPATRTAPPAQSAGPQQTVAFVLNPVLLRGTQGVQPLVIPATATQVRLKVRFEAKDPRYEAVLRTAENKMVWRQKDLEAERSSDGKLIALELPSTTLPPADYILTLQGVSAAGRRHVVAEYAFRVTQK